MSDAELREQERRWKESNLPADEASYLLARVRAGELSPQRLELAARLDHPAARIALGSMAPALFDPDSEQDPFEDDEAAVRAAIAAARFVLPPKSAEARHALAAAEAWARCPCAAHAEAAHSSALVAQSQVPFAIRVREAEGGSGLVAAYRAATHASDPGTSRRPSRTAIDAALHALRVKAIGPVATWVSGTAEELMGAFQRGEDLLEAMHDAFVGGAPDAPARLRGVIRDEVVPWCLGYGDPLAGDR